MDFVKTYPPFPQEHNLKAVIFSRPFFCDLKSVLLQLGEGKWHKTAMGVVDGDATVQGWVSALVAIHALAKPAINPDRRHVSPIAEVQAVGINQAASVLDLASHANCQLLLRQMKAAAGSGNGAGNGEIGGAVLHLHDLIYNFAGGAEGLMNVPFGTGSAEPGEMEAAG
jgi:hypothetical protein